MQVLAARSTDRGDAGGVNHLPVSLIVLAVLSIAYCVVRLATTTETGVSLPAGWVGVVTEFAAVVLGLRAAIRTRFSRGTVVLGAAAIALYSAGDAYSFFSDIDKKLPAPESFLNVMYLGFYVLMLGIFAVELRKVEGVPWPSLLNSLVTALAGASVAALFLIPALLDPTPGTAASEGGIAVVHLVLMLVLAATIGGVCTSLDLDLDLGPRRPFLLTGLTIVFLADNVGALGLPYSLGPLTGIGWVAGIAMIALWADAAGDPAASSTREYPRIAESLTVLLFTVAALTVLLVGGRRDVPVLAEVLAALALVLAAVPSVFRNRIPIAMALTDELTGLPNRRALLTDTPRWLDGTPGALFLIDLDRFKHVNDALGHDVGDALLIKVGERFKAELRSEDMLARLGGDEFAVFLSGVSKDDAVAAAVRLGAALASPIEVGSASLQSSASIGIALTPANGTDLNLLMRKADIAMFRAKSKRSGHHVYDPSDRDDGALRLQTIQELHTAFATDQFELSYQPKVRLSDSGIAGMEALIRWNHPVRGQLPPARFLALAEEAGLMPELSALVLEQAITQVASWHRQGIGVSVAVNLSGSDITPELLPRILGLLKQHGVPPERLMLEITEDILMTDPVQTEAIIRRLRLKGIQMSIDDFGTGYSSLAYLRDLPVDELKLDRSFITAMDGNSRASGLVRSIIDLAHSLGLRVVAEGVDNEPVRLELRELGCDIVQGFHIARPLPAGEVPGWLLRQRPATTPDEPLSLLRSGPEVD